MARKSKRQTAKDFANTMRPQIIQKIAEELQTRINANLQNLHDSMTQLMTDVLTSYTTAEQVASAEGETIAPLEPITEVVYEHQRKRGGKEGAFKMRGRANEAAKTLQIRISSPSIAGRIIRFQFKFEVSDPLLIALEKGEVSWNRIPTDRTIRLLRRYYKEEKDPRKRDILIEAMEDVQNRRLKSNPRPYFKTSVMHSVKSKSFLINLLT